MSDLTIKPRSEWTAKDRKKAQRRAGGITMTKDCPKKSHWCHGVWVPRHPPEAKEEP